MKNKTALYKIKFVNSALKQMSLQTPNMKTRNVNYEFKLG